MGGPGSQGGDGVGGLGGGHVRLGFPLVRHLGHVAAVVVCLVPANKNK